MKALIAFLASILKAIFGNPRPAPEPYPHPDPVPVKKPTIKAPDAWMSWAHKEATDGIAEEPNRDNRGPKIDEYIRLGKCGAPGQPYCAVVVNAALERVGLPGTRNAMARSFETNKNFVKLKGPAYGAITTFWRGSKTAGTGHVGFYVGQTEHHIYTLGGNQGDDFNESPFPKDGKSFGHVGYYWPASLPLPEIKPILLDGKGKPINLKVT